MLTTCTSRSEFIWYENVTNAQRSLGEGKSVSPLYEYGSWHAKHVFAQSQVRDLKMLLTQLRMFPNTREVTPLLTYLQGRIRKEEEVQRRLLFAKLIVSMETRLLSMGVPVVYGDSGQFVAVGMAWKNGGGQIVAFPWLYNSNYVQRAQQAPAP